MAQTAERVGGRRWHERSQVHGHSYGGKWTDGLNLQQIYEGGAAFEALVDHPSYIGKVRRFVGGEGTFDYAQGELFIDENFASLRGPGEAIGIHSGQGTSMRNQSFYVSPRRLCSSACRAWTLKKRGEVLFPGGCRFHCSTTVASTTGRWTCCWR